MSEKKRDYKQNNVAEDIDFGRLFGALLDNKWLILGVTALFACIGIIYALQATPIYVADSLIQIEQNDQNSILSNISEMIPGVQPQSAAEIELIKSRLVLGKTVDDLKLDSTITPDTLPFIGAFFNRVLGKEEPRVIISQLDTSADLLGSILDLEVIDSNNYIIKDANDNVIISGKKGVYEKNENINILVSDIYAKPQSKFNVIKTTELNAINSVLANLTILDKGKDTGVLGMSYEDRDPVRAEKVLNSIDENYLLQNIARKSAEAGKSLDFIKVQLPKVRTELEANEDKLNLYRQQHDSVDLSLEAKSMLDTNVQLDSQINDLTIKEADVSQLYTKDHPTYKALLEQKNILEKEKDELTKKISSLPQTQQDILKLTRNVQAGQDVYMQLLNKQQELDITKASTVGNVRIVDEAVTQPLPVRPKKAMIIFAATFMGLILSIIFVISKAILHKGIEDTEELEAKGITVYANIPFSEWQSESSKNIKKDKKLRILAEENPTDLVVESIRSLRTSLHFAMLEAKNNIILISGASPSIGKTFVSVNLSTVIARTGKKILLIDADMRKGYIHDIFNIKSSIGLSEILSGQASAEDAIKKTSIEKLDIITRGIIPPNPSELLMGKKFEDLMKWASENYEMIIIDTPPVLAVTDASIIGRLSGTSLLVVRYGVNTVREVVTTYDRFEKNGVEIKGIIVNAIVKKASNKYYYYSYDYSSKVE